MGEIEKTQAADELAEIGARNPGIHPDVIAVYVDALMLYREASENIARNGAVTGHPKTGAAIINPYLPIRDMAAKTISRFHKDNPNVESGKVNATTVGDGDDGDMRALMREIDKPEKKRKKHKEL